MNGFELGAVNYAGLCSELGLVELRRVLAEFKVGQGSFNSGGGPR